ncbi:hypothetical protein [Salinibaculum rarum]|uniref:hypothetical protein n=1 Tax=Salinibaculum rarum TaxID=3058903 RepID=UPI00265FD7FF|nr:hypothetical protein [Salinibaculum sp. KK48]
MTPNTTNSTSDTAQHWYDRGILGDAAPYARTALTKRILLGFINVLITIGITAGLIMALLNGASRAVGPLSVFFIMCALAMAADPPLHFLSWLFDSRNPI